MSAHYEGVNFWGVLINPDKSPAPLLEQLCLGIAQVMTSFDEFATTDLTPERLAAFYNKVGGNYDVLFLETKPSALSFIYQRLGCFHSIQPSTDPYKPPSVPALQPNGFVRWQTIQLLLDPDEHSRYLQNAVELWDIEAPNGGFFPKEIPRAAFPTESDAEMVEWHEEVSRRFEFDYWKKNIFRSSPPSFGTYYCHFSQKETPSPTPKEDSCANNNTNHPRSSPTRRQHATTTNIPTNRHRRRSAEVPSSSSGRVHSTSTSTRREDLPPQFTFTAPRAPSPPTWSRQPVKTRGRERSFARPVSPRTVFGNGNETSDASSEESLRDQHHSPRINRPCYNETLSPQPSTFHTRRHSHEAYLRKPRREISPDSPPPRQYVPREYHPDPGRLYDSDSARRVRGKGYEDPSVGFREHIPVLILGVNGDFLDDDGVEGFQMNMGLYMSVDLFYLCEIV
ncbi:hypothetical protein EYZ11_003493 [Aspergillus tanneri]|uniref:DUF7514 domain-containing protein n=1 Tax=Aspergillus tanneri TaxID=1220188 RepID=A0A4S3JNN4_9EURO|nr:hypothetical protein EYZ11_003493 [Aspergillus tanneri]